MPKARSPIACLPAVNSRLNPLIVFLSAALAVVIPAAAQDYGKLYSVPVTAAADHAAGAVTLSWPARTDMQWWKVYRLTNGVSSLLATLPATATGYTATGLSGGQTHDLRVAGRTTASKTLTGAVRAGFEVPLRSDRGGLFLVVEESVAAALDPEISRLRSDLSGEGWKVKTLSAARTDSADTLRTRIRAEWLAAPETHRSVLLLGHVPVPYSGSMAPDGHTDHTGAWPADCLYGEMDAALTDASVNVSTATRPENHNIPGDTKADLSRLTGTQEMSVGRIDFYGLPCFAPETEISLLRRYLDRNHAWRTGLTACEPRAVITDGLAGLTEALAAPQRSAWPGIFGASGVVDAPWTSPPPGTSAFSLTNNFAGYSSMNGVGSAADFASRPPTAIFTLWFGSYFGDWDSQDNFLRAAIAAPGAALTAVWSGRPQYHTQGMGMGGTAGESLVDSWQQANDGTASPGYFPRSAHLALMGDPTLTLRSVPQPENMIRSTSSSGLPLLSWSAPPGTAGVHLWRRDDADAAWTQLTSTPDADGTFQDTSPALPETEYLIRAVRLEMMPAGSWWNGSTGILIPAAQPAVHPLDAWKTLHLSTLPAADRTDEADPDADGRSNLMEYALGSLPLTVDLPSATSVTSTAESLIVECSCAPTHPGVLVQLECSADLSAWSPVPPLDITTSITPTGCTALRAVIPLTSERCFVRLTASRM